jgi:two-component system chemotaxis response regulator CheV
MADGAGEKFMAGILESVNQRTQLVGQNRLELLLFKLSGPQVYGINVFKVKEVLQCPKLTQLPRLHPVVRGVAHIRGGTISIMDLSLATGQGGLRDIDDCFVIITEYNRATQGFLVRSVERIVNMNWEEIHPPPKGSGREHYLTAVTSIDGKLVEIIDVEKVLSEVSPMQEQVSAGIIDDKVSAQAVDKHILIVDDSSIARKQIKRCVETIGVTTTLLNDGRQALDYLRELADKGEDVTQKLLMVISDIEMPEMDGYTLTAEIRNDPRMSKMHVLLHTSLSGIFNQAMVQKVGANDFLAKFNPDQLASKVAERIRQVEPD